MLEEGLTISGKPLKDHQEVIGHARAIELVYQALSEPLSEPFIFNLHKAILTEKITDIYKPIGAWKIEPNGTYAITEDGAQPLSNMLYPFTYPGLCQSWLTRLTVSRLKL